MKYEYRNTTWSLRHQLTDWKRGKSLHVIDKSWTLLKWDDFNFNVIFTSIPCKTLIVEANWGKALQLAYCDSKNLSLCFDSAVGICSNLDLGTSSFGFSYLIFFFFRCNSKNYDTKNTSKHVSFRSLSHKIDRSSCYYFFPPPSIYAATVRAVLQLLLV